jgi:membrane protease YdiL (CAAX protease family)
MISSTTTLVSILVITPFSMKVIDRSKWTPVKEQVDRSWWRDLGMGCLVGFFSIGLIFVILAAFGNVRVTGFNTDFWGLDFLISILGWLLIFICVGVYEEIIFRGYVFKNLSEGFFGSWLIKENTVIVSGIVSSLAFSILHLTNPYTNFLSFINILVIGCLLCLSVLVTRRLAFAIGFHILWNFSQGVIFGIPVSGLAPQVPLLDVKISGAVWFTGGLFGFEGSVLCLITNLITTVLILYLLKRKNKDLKIYYEIADYNPVKPSISDSRSDQ